VPVALATIALGVGAPGALGATSTIPNDAFFAQQWGDQNVGQPIPIEVGSEEFGEPKAGISGAEDRAVQAWRVTTGSRSIVIGEADTGVDYNHPDLAANIWSNPATGPGHLAGCPTGAHGYNVLNGTCEPMDQELAKGKGGYGGHGTHVAGIIGAVGNNEIGVAGMNWQTTILPVRWLEAAGHDLGDVKLIEALRWFAKAAREGVNIRVVNDSPTFEGTPTPQNLKEEREAIEELGAEGILFVTAAGNTAENNDEEGGRYPCRLDLANEICVTASNDKDELPSWANFGPRTVDLAAPGVSIYSTLREGKYGYLSGGSMAAAQVSGAAALILSVDPSLSATALKADILDNVDSLPSLAGKVRTGGRLDVCKALPGCEAAPSKESPPPGPQTTGNTGAQSSVLAAVTQSSAVAIAATTFTVKGGRTTIKLRCIGSARCSSKLTLKVEIKTRHGGSVKTTVETIGKASFSLAAGSTASVTVKLNANGRALLSAAHGQLRALLTILRSASGPTSTVTKNVRLVSRTGAAKPHQ
jgi:subtilisin family serine protease